MGLEARIRDEIRRRGPIPFADFMRAALYDPEEGYYTSGVERVGRDGDFYTAPSAHPAFGAMLALQLERMWELLDRSEPFTVVEGGGGKGLLAGDVLSYAQFLDPAFGESLEYRIVEAGRTGSVSGPNAGGGIEVAWSEGADNTGVGTGVFLSNELFDASPRRRVVNQAGRLYELLVDVGSRGFVELLGPPSTLEIEEYFARVGVTLPEGCQAEVDLVGPAFLAGIAASIERGFTITIDYGYPAESLFSERRRRGTLMCHHRHVSSSNPYIRVGKQDITAHVDFTALALAGESGGMATEGLFTQQRYLKKLGIQTLVDGLRRMPGLSEEAVTANRMPMLELTAPGKFGAFGVLVQSKGAGSPFGEDRVVFSRARLRGADLPAPLRTKDHTPVLEGAYPHHAALSDLRLLE